ncbi:SusC/RagA family TonB-linked outer membrane protein [uncultured Tenacibaculum sp.]|uniref:SusC/RagA family TonB-linked outer membrane protein n=1 Tax=uncultured Tenacibaculum sp. TaxID=174713 RepID=UPI002622BD1C|nr:SusC/RagA family TonB-linked outer membrane protein [uncultured Tenacibaculum sp.]
MRTKFNGILTLLLALIVQISFAQDRTISGTVSDESGPLPGVTVLKKGTTQGTETDFDGNYTIKVKTGDVLVFSFVGMKTTEKTIGAANTINVTMVQDSNLLDEIVVTGVAQGVSTKKLGFKVEKVSVEGTQTVPTVDAASALIGKVAGAQIVRGSGNPLRNSAIILRGASSIEGSTEPLVIIDGIITEGGMRDINMSDVQSFEVVKGAAAASLYGSLAGNGVIQIITKKGTSGKPKVTFKSEYGFNSIANSYPLATKHDRAINADGSVDFANADPDGLFDNDFQQPLINNIDTFVKSQGYSQYSASISQRLDKIDYFASAQRSEVEGIIQGLRPYVRKNFRLNLNADVNDKLSLGFTTSFIESKGQEVAQAGQGDNLFFNFLTANPTVDLNQLDANGNFIPFFSGNGWINEYQNPLYVARNRKDDRKEDRFIAGINANYQVTDNLSVQANLSKDRNAFKYTRLFPRGYVSGSVPNATRDNGNIFIRNSVTERTNSSVQVNYNTKFNDFNLRSSFKYLLENVNFSREDGSSSNFLTNDVSNLQQGTQNINVSSFRSATKTQNFFLTADLDWKDKLIIGGLIRTDRSSLFGQNNRDQIFYRGSFAYRLGEDIDTEWIDELKFRASYGTAGLRPGFGDIFETFTVTEASITFNQVGNPNLKSPTISEFEAGFDLDFLNKYKFGFTYAKSNTKDALLTVPLSGAVPGRTTVRNLGETQYTAYEASLSGTPISNEDFSWNFGITFSSVNNEYVSLGNVAPFNRAFGGTLFDSAPAINLFRVEAGQPYGAMFGNKLVTSLDQLTVDASGNVLNEGLNLPLSAFSVNAQGHVIVTANDGNTGLVNAGGEQAIRLWDANTNSRAVERIGNTTPDFILGISNTFNYKNFSLYTLFDIQQGGDVYNYTKQLLYFNDRHADLQKFGAQGQPASYANASSTIYNGAAPIDYFVEDGSFVKLREVSLSYNFGEKILGTDSFFQDIKLTLSGRNLITITDYTGWDPEVAQGGSPIFKLDEFAYPNFRTYAFSVQATF